MLVDGFVSTFCFWNKRIICQFLFSSLFCLWMNTVVNCCSSFVGFQHFHYCVSACMPSMVHTICMYPCSIGVSVETPIWIMHQFCRIQDFFGNYRFIYEKLVSIFGAKVESFNKMHIDICIFHSFKQIRSEYWTWMANIGWIMGEATIRNRNSQFECVFCLRPLFVRFHRSHNLCWCDWQFMLSLFSFVNFMELVKFKHFKSKFILYFTFFFSTGNHTNTNPSMHIQ